MMSSLHTIPNELLDKITSHLDSLTTLNLLLTCRALCHRVLPSMHLHAVAPRENISALHWAAMRGHLSLAKYLLTVFPVDLLDELGNTPLHSVARWSHEIVTEHLQVVRSTHHCVPSLTCASPGVNTDSNATGDVFQIPVEHAAQQQGAVSMTHAIKNHSARMARLLLDAGANPNTISLFGQPVILTASKHAATIGVLELLLAHGADVNVSNNLGYTALMVAAKNGLLHTVHLLVRSGANVNAVDRPGDSCLAEAVMSNDHRIAEYLVRREEFDINTKGAVYLTALYGCEEALKILLQRGALPNPMDERFRLPLYAQLLRNTEITLPLLRERRDRHQMNLTPLMAAIYSDNLPIAEILLGHWTIRTDTSLDTFLTLLLACERGATEVVEVLLEKGVDVNMVDADGLTVMAYATRAGWTTVVETLAWYGAE